MKYIFLLAILCTAQVGYAQVDFNQSPTDPAVWYNDQNQTVTNPSGGSLQGGGTNNTPSGGTFTGGGATNTQSGGGFSGGGANNTPSGGTFTGGGANNTTSGGTFTGLREISKPSLTIVGITNWFIQVFNYVSILLFTASLVMFMYGVFVLMFLGGTNDESRSKGKKFMTWGIISLFVMTSTWGLVNILKTSIFGTTGALRGPQFK